MDSHKLKFILITVLATFAALYLGIAAATEQTAAVMWISGTLTVAFLLALGKNVWVLIPIAMGLAGNISAIPGSPAPWWAATAAVGTIFGFRFLMRRQRLIPRITWLEFAIFIQLVAVGQSFLRNPTGLSVLGGDTVGGKPYIAYFMAIVAFFLLANVQTNLKTCKYVVLILICLSILDGLLMASSMFFPALSAMVLPLYTNVWFDSAHTGSGVDNVQNTRINAAKDLGPSLCIPAFTLFRPLSTINPFYPLRFILMLSGIYWVLVGGYRTNLILVGVVAVVSSLVRRRFLDVVVVGTLGFIALFFLVATNLVQQLPYGAQRAMSVLPIAVSENAKQSAEDSAEWRFEMWRLALFTDRYIHNKWLGDGFAFRADELAAMQEGLFGDRRRSSRFKGIDQFLAKGSYHGFHVEAIRGTGFFGLICALVGMFIFLRYAWILIQHYRGRPEWGYILYICIPFLIYPFFVMLVFGVYKTDMPKFMVLAGMLKILDNIRVRELAEARAEHAVPAAINAPFRPRFTGHLPQPDIQTR